MSLDNDTQAAKDFYREVRLFSEQTNAWQQAVFYQTLPDEAHDLTLVSYRVYGRDDEYLAIMAAAGINTFDQPLKQQMLTLPTESQLSAIKKKTGFESIATQRDDFRPIWIDY